MPEYLIKLSKKLEKETDRANKARKKIYASKRLVTGLFMFGALEECMMSVLTYASLGLVAAAVFTITGHIEEKSAKKEVDNIIGILKEH